MRVDGRELLPADVLPYGVPFTRDVLSCIVLFIRVVASPPVVYDLYA